MGLMQGPPLCFLAQAPAALSVLVWVVSSVCVSATGLGSTPPLQICVVISADRQIFIASDKLHPTSASAALPVFDLPFAKLSRAEFFFWRAAEHDLMPTHTNSAEHVQNQHGGLKSSN